ncbi:hypothetical protein DFH11DRAFT_1629525 [Phellopilus nigrolimitatus]|nr:hypothetical protein DFH11DRAFT_1629525 [Phellopilus nigrolimitatus]
MRAAPLRRFTTLVFTPSLFSCSFKKIGASSTRTERVNRVLGAVNSKGCDFLAESWRLLKAYAEPRGLLNPSARSTRSRSAKFQTNLVDAACKMDAKYLVPGVSNEPEDVYASRRAFTPPALLVFLAVFGANGLCLSGRSIPVQ